MKEITYNLLGIRPKGMTLCRSEIIKNKYAIVTIEPITKEIEECIDNSFKYHGELCYQKNERDVIPAKNIYLYGEVNLNDEEDIYNIERFNLITKEKDSNWIYSNFDFDKGCFTTINGVAKRYSTEDCLEWFRYCYCLIGKPKRIIVYKQNNINKYDI